MFCTQCCFIQRNVKEREFSHLKVGYLAFYNTHNGILALLSNDQQARLLHQENRNKGNEFPFEIGRDFYHPDG